MMNNREDKKYDIAKELALDDLPIDHQIKKLLDYKRSFLLSNAKSESELMSKSLEVLIKEVDAEIVYRKGLKSNGLNNPSSSKNISTRKSGAPENPKVPQAIIEKIVLECIEDRSSKRFFHHSGRWEGKANINQILKCIDELHPEFLDDKGIGERQMKNRIKKALPDDMK